MTLILALALAWLAYGLGFNHHARLVYRRLGLQGDLTIWTMAMGMLAGPLNSLVEIKICKECRRPMALLLVGYAVWREEGHQ